MDTKTALDEVRKYFESIPSQPAPPPVDMTEPPQTEERRLTIDDPLARLPRVDIAYKIPPSLSPDDDALDVLATILSGGRSSRFYETIVRQKQLSPCRLRRSRERVARPGPVQHRQRRPLPGKSSPMLEAAIDAEIERVKAGPIADWEMEKARNGARRQFMGSLGTRCRGRCSWRSTRCSTTTPIGSTRAADRHRQGHRRRRPARRQQYLVPENRTVVMTLPKAGGRDEGRRSDDRP